jgi:hypothetical protein
MLYCAAKALALSARREPTAASRSPSAAIALTVVANLLAMVPVAKIPQFIKLPPINKGSLCTSYHKQEIAARKHAQNSKKKQTRQGNSKIRSIMPGLNLLWEQNRKMRHCLTGVP